MMTSLAFILGVVPLVLSTGAGAEMRRTLGTAVFAGMLGVTLFGIFQGIEPTIESVLCVVALSHKNPRAKARRRNVRKKPTGLRSGRGAR
jgi:hypothetical protein